MATSTPGWVPVGFEDELMANHQHKIWPSHITPISLSERSMPVNAGQPTGFDATSRLPAGFLEFLSPLHAALTLRPSAPLVARRETAACRKLHGGQAIEFSCRPRSLDDCRGRGKIGAGPEWCFDQRNQMTGAPARRCRGWVVEDAELRSARSDAGDLGRLQRPTPGKHLTTVNPQCFWKRWLAG